jgi:hypothetical protein
METMKIVELNFNIVEELDESCGGVEIGTGLEGDEMGSADGSTGDDPARVEGSMGTECSTVVSSGNRESSTKIYSYLTSLSLVDAVTKEVDSARITNRINKIGLEY